MMTAKQADDLLQTLSVRFAQNMQRHPGVVWDQVAARLNASPAKLDTLSQMESTGGEPDVIGQAEPNSAFVFVDCSAETPTGRRSLCFDRKALDARKENKPKGSAQELAASMGCDLLTEAQYRGLQEFGAFDQKTSSWIATPEPIRALGGALFCDRRYGTVFTYHNGADSYYAVRGFRGRLLV
ncbi:MAG: DUF4256 domain-containing protein [Rhizobiaceae bacterium]